MHSHFEANGILFMASEVAKVDREANRAGMVHLSIDFDDVTEEEKVFGALSEGGKITMPLQDTFWGAKFGMLTDKFGVNWMFNCEKK